MLLGNLKNRAALWEGSKSFAAPCAWVGSCITKLCSSLEPLGSLECEGLGYITGVHLKRVGIWLFMLSRGCFKEKEGQLMIYSQMLNLRHLSVIEGVAVIYPWPSVFAGVHITGLYARLW